MPNYEKLVEDLQAAHVTMAGHERSGLVLRADECYTLGLLLECAWQTIINLEAENEILEASYHALDPEGSRSRLAMQPGNGLSPFEEAPRSKGEWSAPAGRPARKPKFYNV